MDKNFVKRQRADLIRIKKEILGRKILSNNADLEIKTEELADEADIANNVVNQNITFNIRHRELQKLRQVEEALQRIEDGTYGICEECDEFIAPKRLQLLPNTTLCIVHAEELERERRFH